MMQSHLFQEFVDRIQLDLARRRGVVHGDDQVGFQQADDLGRLGGVQSTASPDRNQRHVYIVERLDLSLAGYGAQVSQVGDR